MAAAVSPSSSPRLPSPPPIAEDQIGPTSPGVSLYEDQANLLAAHSADTGASRRIRPGTKADDMTEGPPLVELSEIDTAFQLTEHLKALYYHTTHPPDSDTTAPVTADLARQLCTPPAGTSREIWLYELGRFLIQKTNAIIVHLFADSPPCSAHTCPEMRASEWQYLCAVHDPPKSCSAIDYCCHTLDWAANTLTSTKMFPSRLGLGSGGVGGDNAKMLAQQIKEITNIFRRVYRIYAHAWFQHREMFWRVEGKTGLYIFYKTVCDEYGLIQPENYTIPPEAEGHEAAATTQEEKPSIPSILARNGGSADDSSHAEPVGNSVLSAGNTTKRHANHTRDLSGSVTSVIQEEAEEEDDDPAHQKAAIDRSSTILHLSEKAEEPMDEEPTADDHDDAVPGIERVDTIKPEPELEPEPEKSEPDAMDVHEATEPGDETTILADSVVETKPDEPGVEVKITPVDPLEPSESPAAQPEEAGKSVAD